MDHKVFVSFSSSDKKLAEKIYDRLERYGVRCWISSRDIAPGDDYQACIVQAIQAADVVLLVFSSHANSSVEVTKELSLASTKLVIPARIEDVVPKGAFQYQISNRQFYDLFEDFDQRLEELCRHVKAVVDAGVSPRVPAGSQPPSTRASIRRKKGSTRWMVLAAAVVVIGAGSVFAWHMAQQKSSAPTAANPAANATAITAASPATSGVTATASESTSGVGKPGAPASAPVAAPIQASAAPEPAVADPAQVASVERTAISAAAKSFAGMLDGTSGFNRYTAIKNLKDRIPNTLNANEAALVLNGTETSRTGAIDVIASFLVPGLDGKEAANIFGNLSGFDRYTALKSLIRVSKLGTALTVADAVAILDNTNSSRTSSIQSLAPLLAPNLGGQNVATVLGNLSGFDRYSALKSIINAGKVRQGLDAAETKLILDPMDNSRGSAIDSLSPLLASSLGGQDVATVLGELNGFNRYSALKSIVNAGKVKQGLSPEDANLITDQMGDQKTSSLQLLARSIR